MEFKIKKCFLILLTSFVIIGCGSSSFDAQEDPDVFYQISPSQKNILRIRYTTGKGAPLIQPFDTKGKFLKKQAIVPSSVLLMTESKNDSIQITYFVGKSDLDMFLPWFKKNKYNVSRIGNYSIKYSYEIHNTYLENKGSEIDSLCVDKKGKVTSLFFNRKLVAKKPTHLFVIKSSEIFLYDPLTKSYTAYTFANNRSLVKDYFKKVLELYEYQ